jgi:thioredoxin
MAVEVRDATFDREVGVSTGPVVVEFWATWCGNCRRVAPDVAALGEEFADSVQLVTVNADENPELVARFGVSSTPTFVVLDRGRTVTTMVGAQPAPVLRGLFETARTGDAGTGDGGASWVPGEACTLPTADRPTRLAEFDELFRSVREVDRVGPTRLRLVLNESGGVADQARDLTARESECCSFFDFDVSSDGIGVVVDVRVPDSRAVMLDGLAARRRPRSRLAREGDCDALR